MPGNTAKCVMASAGTIPGPRSDFSKYRTHNGLGGGILGKNFFSHHTRCALHRGRAKASYRGRQAEGRQQWPDRAGSTMCGQRGRPNAFPFLLVPAGRDLVLIAPFPKRRRGPTHEEVGLVEAVSGRLGARSPGGSALDHAGRHHEAGDDRRGPASPAVLSAFAPVSLVGQGRTTVSPCCTDRVAGGRLSLRRAILCGSWSGLRNPKAGASAIPAM
jgi:hypothetical protein